MAQLCLYIEDELMDQIRAEAHKEQMSLSGYVRNALKNSSGAQSKWPDSFWDTFGAITDSTFTVPGELAMEDDAIRLSFD